MFKWLFKTDKDKNKDQNKKEKVVDPYAYPKLPPRGTRSINYKEYITERFNGNIKWYDREAGKAKKNYLRLRVISVVGGALVPVLINMIDTVPYIQEITTVISLMVLLAVSIDSVYHYGEQWSSYRSTEQFMRREYYLYTVNEGPYRQLNDRLSFELFVERIEEAIAAENSSTLRIMATVNETKNASSEKKKMQSKAVIIDDEIQKKIDKKLKEATSKENKDKGDESKPKT